MKRLFAGALWLPVGWFVGALATFALDLGPGLSPIVAVALAGVIVADPRRIIWNGPARTVEDAS